MRLVAFLMVVLILFVCVPALASSGIPEPVSPDTFFAKVTGLFQKVLEFLANVGFYVCMAVLFVGAIIWAGGKMTNNPAAMRGGAAAIVGSLVAVAVIEVAPWLVSLARGALK
ncbi:MAG: hypothetical protein AB1816_03790 [Bacillota bacterium]